MSDNAANVVAAMENLENIGTENFKHLVNHIYDFRRREDDAVQNLNEFLEERHEMEIHDEVYEIAFRGLCNDMNGCKFNTCAAHSAQLLIRELINKFALLLALKRRLADIVRFCKNRQQIRKRIKEACGVTLIDPVWTRWNTVVESAQRLIKVKTNFVLDIHF